jgi:Tn3 transposase DDE domain
LTEPGLRPRAGHALRSASVGVSRAARSAGYRPATAPTPSAAASPPHTVTGGMTGDQPRSLATASVTAEPAATLMRRLRSNSRKNRIYKVFREVGRSVRTVALLRYLADPRLRARITAATNKVESYHGFTQWLSFGNNGVLADNDPAEQEKLIKLNTLLANCVIFHNALDIMDVVRGLVAEGWLVTAGQLGTLSPYLRGHISRFGAYATDELTRQPEAFNPVLKEIDFTALSLAA